MYFTFSEENEFWKVIYLFSRYLGFYTLNEFVFKSEVFAWWC